MGDKKKGLTEKKKKFCQAYVNGLDGKKAAIEAGYSARSASSQASRMLANDEDVKAYIAELSKKMESEKIADAREINELLTSILRRELTEPRLRGVGNGVQVIEYTKPQIKDIATAARMRAEILNMFKHEEKQTDVVKTVVDGSAMQQDEQDEELEE